MSDRELKKYTIEVTILADRAPDMGLLPDLANQIIDENWCGDYHIIDEEDISEEDALDEIDEMGGDPEDYGIDEKDEE